MKTKTAPKEKNSLKIVLFFIACVTILVLISLTVKTVLMIRVSKFDSSHRFTILIEQQKKVLELLSFDPTVPSLAVIHMAGEPLPQSQVGAVLGVLPDAQVTIPDDLKLTENTSSGVGTLLGNYGKIHTSLTLYDILRFYFLAKSITLSNKHFVSVRLPMDSTSIDKIVSSVLLDTSISQENVSVQIINASGVPGLANRLARLVTNMGGNVVSVTTSQTQSNHSSIRYFRNMSYTLTKLSRGLDYSTTALANETIADIVITIGKDEGKTTKF